MTLSSQDLSKKFSTPLTSYIPVGGGEVIEVSIKDKTIKRHWTKHLKFLDTFDRVLNETQDYDKALLAGVTEVGESPAWGEKLFKSKSFQEWSARISKQFEALIKLTPGYIASIHLDNIEGRIKLNSSQLASLEQVAKRKWAEVSKIEAKIEAVAPKMMDDYLKEKQNVEVLEAQLRDALKGQAAWVTLPWLKML